ncbi:MAG: hypothetical protein IJ634_01230 [Bacteroidales bacterium]|nr:hypothetical protein [Bacteroidales bacterium]
MSHLLSKSKYIRGLQCERALWLDVYQPRLARYTREQMRRFDAGRDFEYSFKSTFPAAIDLSAELGRKVDAYPERTAQLLDANPAAVLFEAGFQYDNVLVLADVVCQREDGTLDIYEVKSGSQLSDTYRKDAAVQHYVISHCRRVNSFSIVHAKKQSENSEYSDYSDYSDNFDNRFAIVDLTEALAAQTDTVASNIAAMKDILAHGEPATPTGQHCLEPYACPYQHYCQQGVRQMSLFE